MPRYLPLVLIGLGYDKYSVGYFLCDSPFPMLMIINYAYMTIDWVSLYLYNWDYFNQRCCLVKVIEPVLVFGRLSSCFVL